MIMQEFILNKRSPNSENVPMVLMFLFQHRCTIVQNHFGYNSKGDHRIWNEMHGQKHEGNNGLYS